MANSENSDSRYLRLYHMSDKFYDALMAYLKINNKTLEELCDEMMLPRYFVGKIVDRNIKASTYRSLLVKIAKHIGIYQSKDNFEGIQPQVIRY